MAEVLIEPMLPFQEGGFRDLRSGKNGLGVPKGVGGVDVEEDWGTLNTELNGLHLEGRIETINGDYSIFYNNLYDVLVKGGELYVKPEESLLGIKIIKAAFESSKTAKRINI